MQYQVSIIPNNIILSHISFRLRQKDNRELYIGYISKTGKLARLIQAHARPPHLKIEGNSCNSSSSSNHSLNKGMRVHKSVPRP